jgi:hypothetical protein
MRNLLIAIALIPAAAIDGTGRAADDSPGTIQLQLQPLRSAPLPNTAASTSAKNNDPECDGQSSSTASVTALISRLVRSSADTAGVQCPIPPVPDESPLQELPP